MHTLKIEIQYTNTIGRYLKATAILNGVRVTMSNGFGRNCEHLTLSDIYSRIIAIRGMYSQLSSFRFLGIKRIS